MGNLDCRYIFIYKIFWSTILNIVLFYHYYYISRTGRPRHINNAQIEEIHPQLLSKTFFSKMLHFRDKKGVRMVSDTLYINIYK